MEKQRIYFCRIFISLKTSWAGNSAGWGIPYFVEECRIKGSGNYLSDSPILTLG